MSPIQEGPDGRRTYGELLLLCIRSCGFPASYCQVIAFPTMWYCSITIPDQ